MSRKIMVPIIIVVVLGLAAALYFLVFSGERPVVYTEYSPGDYFVTNVKDSNRLLKTGVILVLDDEKFAAGIDVNKALIRDTIIFILRDQDEATLRKSGSDEGIRKAIIAKLNTVLATEHVYDVYFTDYVMQ